MVTAMPQSADYNGMKFVAKGSRPSAPTTVLQNFRALAERNEFGPRRRGAGKSATSTSPEYIEHLRHTSTTKALAPLRYRRATAIRPATAAPADRRICSSRNLPFSFVKVFPPQAPTAAFPNGVPNPMIEKTAQSRSSA